MALPDTRFSEYPRDVWQRFDQFRTAALSLGDPDCGSVREFWTESMADTHPRLDGGGVGELAHRWQLMCHELADYGAVRSIGSESVFESDMRCLSHNGYRDKSNVSGGAKRRPLCVSHNFAEHAPSQASKCCSLLLRRFTNKALEIVEAGRFERQPRDEGPMPRFSLIIATLSRTTELRRLLESFTEQEFSDYEVILVDQN